MKVYFYRSAAERGKFTQLEKRESESDCDIFSENDVESKLKV